MKIAFYLFNDSISEIDCTQAEIFNPGIGGSQLICIQIASFLTRFQSVNEIIILANKYAKLPDEVSYVVVDDIQGAFEYCRTNTIDYIVIDTKYLTKRLLRSNYDVKILGWANCFIPDEEKDILSQCDNLVKIICVGDEQWRELSEHPIGTKASVIYPPVPSKILEKYKCIQETGKRGNNVVYAGSLLEIKGFGYLAKSWKKVVEVIPDAQLYVIGTGKLYNRCTKLGSYGITYEPFESQLVKELSYDGETIMPSVHFMGILGEDKYDIFAKCKVGVPNPGGETETFCITAAEMQQMGCIITTINKGGFVNSVYNKKYLYNTTDQLPECIIKALSEGDNNYKDTLEYLENFSPNSIVAKWQMLFEQIGSPKRNICKDVPLHFLYKYLYCGKDCLYLLYTKFFVNFFQKWF